MRSFSNTKGTATGLALTLALSLAAMPPTAVADARFIVFGDAPYLSKPPEGRHKRDPFKGKYAQNTLLEDKIAPAIQSAAHPFLIHLGDMKDGAESCTNALIRERYNQLMALHPGRVFYTPGDNDWTDCDRQWLDEPYSEIRRLEFLRTLIASNSMTLPADWHYAIQPEFPENARWTHGGVMFATVHIVGTNNGREEFGEDDPETARRLVDARDRANRYWLEAAFDAANRFGADAGLETILAELVLGVHELFFRQQLLGLVQRRPRIGDHISFEIKDALELLERHVEQQTDALRQRLEAPDMGDWRRQFDMAHPDAPYHGDGTQHPPADSESSNGHKQEMWHPGEEAVRGGDDD